MATYFFDTSAIVSSKSSMYTSLTTSSSHPQSNRDSPDYPQE